MLWLAIILLVIAVILVISSFRSPLKSKHPVRSKSVFDHGTYEEKNSKGANTVNVKSASVLTQKKCPIGIVIIGILIMLHGIFLGLSTVALLKEQHQLRGLFFLLLILAISWFFVGIGLIKGYAVCRKIALITQGLAIVLALIFVLIPPITQEEYAKQQYERYRQHQQYLDDIYDISPYESEPTKVYLEISGPTKREVRRQQVKDIITIILSLIVIGYLLSPGVKKYFGAERQSFSLK